MSRSVTRPYPSGLAPTQIIPTVLPPPTLADWDRCRDVTRIHGRTFYFACQLLPPTERRCIHAIYAWCRHADDIVDTAAPDGSAAAHEQLDRWLATIDRPVDPVSRAFAWVVRYHGVPVEPAQDLIAGVRMDLERISFETWDDLRWYSYCVAGTVGLLTAPILGCIDQSALPHAVDLGIAMQLTNILRDVAEDAALGRVYLPDEDLARFGVSRESLLAMDPDGDFRGLMRFEIERARGLYRSAQTGIPALSWSGQITTIAGSYLYREILHRIEERGYDVFDGRATISTRRKMRKMPLVIAAFLRMQLSLLGTRPRV
ncbi:MAG: phytoene/squalene synthase family protein [Chloroflexota bacterium]|nr:phytoene/squalene synthase family protein [Chloroflexota bacterium]